MITAPAAKMGIVSMNPRLSFPCPSRATRGSAVALTINTPTLEPIIRYVVSITRWFGSGVSADRIAVTGVLIPV